jgi:hypothetical protein
VMMMVILYSVFYHDRGVMVRSITSAIVSYHFDS